MRAAGELGGIKWEEISSQLKKGKIDINMEGKPANVTTTSTYTERQKVQGLSVSHILHFTH